MHVTITVAGTRTTDTRTKSESVEDGKSVEEIRKEKAGENGSDVKGFTGNMNWEERKYCVCKEMRIKESTRDERKLRYNEGVKRSDLVQARQTRFWMRRRCAMFNLTKKLQCKSKYTTNKQRTTRPSLNSCLWCLPSICLSGFCGNLQTLKTKIFTSPLPSKQEGGKAQAIWWSAHRLLGQLRRWGVRFRQLAIFCNIKPIKEIWRGIFWIWDQRQQPKRRAH